jgi:peptide/nickel transport system permease protein
MTDVSVVAATATTRGVALASAAGWAAYLVRRLVRLVISALVLLSGAFAMIHLVPGDPVRAALGDSATPELIAVRRHELGLDQPIMQQYFGYVRGAFTGHLGTSIVTEQPVGELIAQRLPNTLSIALPAFVLIVVIAVPLGLLVAIRTQHGRARITEVGYTTVTGVLNSVPEFVLAIGLVAVFAVGLHALPVAGQSTPGSYVLPVLALVGGPAATLSRVVRLEALKVLDAEYVRTARGKRLPTLRIYLRHVLPNMVTAALTYGGILLSGLAAGTVIVENVFAWPGLGSQVSQAVIGKDYPVVQGVVLVLGALVLAINLTVDIVLAVLDPRSRLREG